MTPASLPPQGLPHKENTEEDKSFHLFQADHQPAIHGLHLLCVFGIIHYFCTISFITKQTPHSSTCTSSMGGHRSSTHTPATICTSNTPAANRSANIVGEQLLE